MTWWLAEMPNPVDSSMVKVNHSEIAASTNALMLVLAVPYQKETK